MYYSTSHTHHDGDVMAEVEGQRSVSSQQVILCFEEAVEILWVVAEHLHQVVESVVVEERLQKLFSHLKGKHDVEQASRSIPAN